MMINTNCVSDRKFWLLFDWWCLLKTLTLSIFFNGKTFCPSFVTVIDLFRCTSVININRMCWIYCWVKLHCRAIMQVAGPLSKNIHNNCRRIRKATKKYDLVFCAASYDPFIDIPNTWFYHKIPSTKSVQYYLLFTIQDSINKFCPAIVKHFQMDCILIPTANYHHVV